MREQWFRSAWDVTDASRPLLVSPLLLSTMINTYQTSLAPPPVPPRHSRSQPVLIPAQLPSQGHSRALLRFLVCVVLLHLFLSVGGFIFLYHKGQMEKLATEGKVAAQLSEKQEIYYKPLARMVVEQQPGKQSSGYLQWDTNHSFLQGINYYYSSWLTIQQPGEYYVYSRVTFSKGDLKHPLASMIKLRKSQTEKDEKTVMQAHCNLSNGSVSSLCTASQGEVIRLEKGNQLSVWVQDLSKVNYGEGATTFGMYKL